MLSHFSAFCAHRYSVVNCRLNYSAGKAILGEYVYQEIKAARLGNSGLLVEALRRLAHSYLPYKSGDVRRDVEKAVLG